MSGPPPAEDAPINSSNISFTHLRTQWNTAGFNGGSDPGTSNISLSEFRGAVIGAMGQTVPGSGAISFNSHFKGNKFYA
jgi:hypothetical protein